MIEKTGQLINSTLFGPHGKNKNNSNLFDKVFFEDATRTSQEISTTGKQISLIYSELSKFGGEKALSGFRDYIQQMALNYDTKSTSFAALSWKDMIKQGNGEALSSLFENYASLRENNKELGNLFMNQAVSAYEKFGSSTASHFVSSLNKIFELGRESDNLQETLKNFISTWKDLSSLGDHSLEDRQNTLQHFASTIKNSNSLDEIKNSIENYKKDLA